MAILNFLGRGSAFNTNEINTSAFIKEKDALFLIDCGSSVFSEIMKRDILSGVKKIYVVITHTHSDHIGSLGDFLFYCYFKKNIKIQICSNDEKIYDYLKISGVTDDKYSFVKDSNFYFPSLDMAVILVPAKHCCLYRTSDGKISELPDKDNKNIFKCNSLLIKYRGSKIFYSGDCSTVDWKLYKDYDEYYVDCCIADYDGNVHYNVNKLTADLIESEIPFNKVYCMHFDSDTAVEAALKKGLNAVDK